MQVAIKSFIASFGVAIVCPFAFSSVAVAQSEPEVTITTGMPLPNPVAAGALSTCDLSAKCPLPTPPAEATITGRSWSWVATVGGVTSPLVTVSQPDPDSSEATLNAKLPPGNWAVTVQATVLWEFSSGPDLPVSGSATVSVNVIGVAGLQYYQPDGMGGGSFVDVTGTLYVLTGTNLQLQAIPTPTPADGAPAFPDGQPVWSGTSGASGTGQSITFSPSTLSLSGSDTQTAKVTCGNTCAEAQIIVYDFTPPAVPVDDFSGRDYDAWGVCEIIDLDCILNPSDLSASDVGGLQWKATSGGGTISAGTDGAGTYQCYVMADYVTLLVMVLAGPSEGENKPAAAPVGNPQEVVPPNGAKVSQTKRTKEFHIPGRVSVGFCGDIFATGKKTVSFKEIQVREGACDPAVEGFYDNDDSKANVHMVSLWFSLLDPPLFKKSYQWDFSPYKRKYDKISSDSPPLNLQAGTFKWDIPHEWKKKGAADETALQYATATMNVKCDANGTCTISKAGSPEFTKKLLDRRSIPENWDVVQ